MHQSSRVAKKLVILFLAANPPDTERLALDREARAIQHALERWPGLFELVTRWAVEPEDVLDLLLTVKPDVVHFSGHGAALATVLGAAHARDVIARRPPANEPGGLMLDGGDGHGHVVSSQAFADTVGSACARLQLVVLNACYSASLADALLVHVPCVVGMSGPIHDDAALAFAKRFYRGLTRGASIGSAVDQAIAQIRLQGLPGADRPERRTRSGDDASNLILKAERIELPCPYPGMRPYTADEANRFYGRDVEIRKLIRRMRTGEREIIVFGSSGSGKTSLVTAGMLPRLARGVTGLGTFVVRELRPGERPTARLDQALEVPAGNRAPIAERVAALLPPHEPGASLLLVVDQLEELFTLADQSERGRFLDALRALRAEPRCTIVLVLRADFLGELMTTPLWAERRERLSLLEVNPLRGDALRRAIRQPALDVGAVVEPDLTERIVADAASEPGILPLLQETLVHLWDSRIDQTLMLADYVALGDGGHSGLAVALAGRADATLRRLDRTQADIARRILLRLISFGEGRADTRRQQPRAQLRAADDDEASFDLVLQTLVHDRLLTIDEDRLRVEPRVDLAHEIMITAWPALSHWREARRDDEKQRRRLELGAAQWVQHGRGTGGLLDAVMLAEARRWLGSVAARELGESAVVMAWVAASAAALTKSRSLVRWIARGAILGLVALVALGMGIAVSVAVDQEAEIERDVLATNAYAAQALAGGVAFRLREQVDATVAIAADPAVAQALHTHDSTVLDQWRVTTGFDTVSLYDRTGVARVQGSVGPNRNRNLGKDYAWRDYFQGARRLGEAGVRGGYISRVLRSESEDLWVFGIAAPMYEDGNWIGIVLITVGTDAVLVQRRLDRASDTGPMAVIAAPRDRSRASTQGEGDYVVVLHDGLTHGAGIAIASPRLRALRATRTERDQLRWNVPDQITDDDHRDPVPGFGGRWLAGFAPVGDTGFVVIVQTRYESALQPNTRLSSRLAWRGLAAILVWLVVCGTSLAWLIRRDRLGTIAPATVVFGPAAGRSSPRRAAQGATSRARSR